MERGSPNQTMQQHSLPSFSGYLQREVPKGIPGGGRLGRGSLPLPLPLPRPFFVIVSLTFPARESIFYLSGWPEGQHMKLPVTRTSFGPRLRRGPKHSQYLRGLAGLNFPDTRTLHTMVTCTPCVQVPRQLVESFFADGPFRKRVGSCRSDQVANEPCCGLGSEKSTSETGMPEKSKL